MKFWILIPTSGDKGILQIFVSGIGLRREHRRAWKFSVRDLVESDVHVDQLWVVNLVNRIMPLPAFWYYWIIIFLTVWALTLVAVFVFGFCVVVKFGVIVDRQATLGAHADNSEAELRDCPRLRLRRILLAVPVRFSVLNLDFHFCLIFNMDVQRSKIINDCQSDQSQQKLAE